MSSALANHKLKPSDLPVPPQSALAILQACAMDEVDTNQLAEFAHNDPALVPGCDQAVMTLKATEQPLGILPNCRFSLSEPISLEGAALYLYSDGVTKAKSVGGEMLGTAGLIHLLQQHQDKPPGQRLQAVMEAIGTPQQLHDDITLLMIDGGQS